MWYSRRLHRFGLPYATLLLLAACSDDADIPLPKPLVEWHPPAEILEKYADSAGVVTRTAMEKGLRGDFARADSDHDGCLDANEARAVNDERWRLSQSTASPLIDFEHTGCIDFDEFAAMPRSLFDQLDKKGDGQLTPKELHPGIKPSAPQKTPPS